MNLRRGLSRTLGVLVILVSGIVPFGYASSFAVAPDPAATPADGLDDRPISAPERAGALDLECEDLLSAEDVRPLVGDNGEAWRFSELAANAFSLTSAAISQDGGLECLWPGLSTPEGWVTRSTCRLRPSRMRETSLPAIGPLCLIRVTFREITRPSISLTDRSSRIWMALLRHADTTKSMRSTATGKYSQMMSGSSSVPTTFPRVTPPSPALVATMSASFQLPRGLSASNL